MDNRETLTPSSGDAILKRHLFSEVARNWIKGRGHIERAYFVRRPSRQSFGFRVAASSGPIPKAPGSAGGYLHFDEHYSIDVPCASRLRRLHACGNLVLAAKQGIAAF